MREINVKKVLLFVSMVFLLALAAFGYYSRPWEEKAEYLTILHTNDVHGRLKPFSYRGSQELSGGMARRATLIKQIEGANKCTFTVDSGDFAQGSLFFNIFKGIPDAKLMSEAGYDVGTLGNHEFDKGMGVLKNMIKHAGFPIVSSNIRFTKDKELQGLVKPYVIKDCHGLKIAFTGFVPRDLKILANAENVEILNVVETAGNIVGEVNQKADLIVVLSHTGIKNDLELAKKVPEIDVIIGGHSHTLLKQPKILNEDTDKTLVLQAGELGVYLGRLDLKIKDREVKNYYYSLIPVNEDIEEDKAVKNKIDVLSSQIQEYTGEIIGQLSVPLGLEGEKIRSKLLPSGSFVTAAIKSKFPDTDIVLQNSGGIRPYKHLGPGAITLADIMRLFPFENTVVTLELKGEHLKSVLETSSSRLPGNSGGFLQSLGLEYTVDTNKPPGNRVSAVLVNKKPLKQYKYYKIAVNNYMFNGGNGYSQFKKGRNIKKSGIMVREAIVEYMRHNSPVAVEVSDRINFLKKES